MQIAHAATAPLMAAFILVVPLSCHDAWAQAVAQDAAMTAAGKDSPAAVESSSDGCVRGRPEPILTRRGDASPPTFRTLGAYEAEETTTLSGKVAVNVHQFGCAHYAVEFAFSIPDLPLPHLPPDAGLRRASDLLLALAVVPAQEATLRSIAELLRARAGAPYIYGRTLQLSEMESVSVRAEAAPPGTRLVVLYDVAL